MPYGKIIDEAAVAAVVKGAVVHDLGAGDLSLSAELVRLGAARVEAVDKRAFLGRVPEKVVFTQAAFSSVSKVLDVAFVAWPESPGLLDFSLADLLESARVVVYLGANWDGTVCGSSHDFGHLLCRPVLSYTCDYRNAQIVYGSLDRRVVRSPLGAEICALDRSRLWTYSEVEAYDQAQDPDRRRPAQGQAKA